MCKPESLKTKDQLMRLWLHESSRVFHDRLINAEDKARPDLLNALIS